MPEDPSQLNAPVSEVSAQTPDTPVTAAATAAENATPPTHVNHASPQTQETGTTGAVVDEGKSDYKSRLAAFLSAEEKVPEPEVRAPEAEMVPPEAPATNPAPAATPAAPLEDDDDPLIKNGVLPNRMRVRPVTPVDVQAMAEFRASQSAGNTQSFVEFVAERYVSKLPTSAAAETAPSTTPAETLDHVTAEIQRLESERDQLNEEFEFEKAKEYKPKLEALRKRERELLIESVKPVEKPEDVEAKRAQEIEPYLIQAAKMFPQSVEATGPLATKAREVFNGWVQNGDPRAAHPSANFYCYVEAAAELGIQPAGAAAPKQAPVTQPPTSPTPPVHRPPASALIAGGEARSQTTRAPEQQGTYEERKLAFLAGKAA